MLKITGPAQNATPRSWSDSDCRLALRFALSQINASPPGMFRWLERARPTFHAQIFLNAVAKLDGAWGTSRFEPVLAEFMYAISAAIPIFELNGKRASHDEPEP